MIILGLSIQDWVGILTIISMLFTGFIYLVKAISKPLDNLSEQIDSLKHFMNLISERSNATDQKLDKRLTKVEDRTDYQDKRLDNLECKTK